MSDGIPFGNYHLLKRLALGGMAEVFLAHDGRRHVALKRMLPVLAQQREYQRRFLHEAQLGAQLSHPYLAQVYEVGLEDAALFLAMEYVHGVSLAQVIERGTATDARFPWPVALRIGVCVAEALQYGGRLGLLHRDVNPNNVMVGYHGGVKLVDLGVARTDASSSLTRANTLLVKPEYAAPEQYLGGRVDTRTDIYGLGLTLYELLAGQHPLRRANAAESVRAVLDDVLPPLKSLRKDVPGPLTKLLGRLTAKDADGRPPNMLSVRRELEACLRKHDEPVGTVEISETVGALFPGAQPLPLSTRPVKRTARLVDGNTRTLSTGGGGVSHTATTRKENT